MRVLHLINSLGAGGAEQSISELIPRLRACGVDLAVVTMTDTPAGLALPARSERPVASLGGGPLRQVRELRDVIRDLQPDVLHTTLFDADVLGRFVGRMTGVPVLTSLVNTSYDPARLDDPAITRWKLLATRTVDGVTARHLTSHFHAISHAVKDSAVRDLRLRPDRVTVVERGRDESRLGRNTPERRARARDGLGVPHEAELIVNVGRQEWQKGQVDLVDAFGLLAGRHPRAHLVIAGRQGHASEELARHVEAVPDRDRIHVLGHREDVAEVFAAADVFAFPSRYEGLGGALIEAMALGLPVVTARVPALEEVVEESGNALLVQPGDADALAVALAGLLGEPSLRTRMGVRSREIFESRFTLDRSVAAMARLYEDVAGRDTSGSGRKRDGSA